MKPYPIVPCLLVVVWAASVGAGDREPSLSNLAITTHGSAGYSWAEVERRIEEHRQRVRWCGPLAAAHFLRLRGHAIDRQILEAHFAPADPRGVPISAVLSLCQKYEKRSQAVRVAPRDLQRLALPCILLINEGRHCIVLQSFLRNSAAAWVWDPSEEREKLIDVNRLHATWNGEVIHVGHPFVDSAWRALAGLVTAAGWMLIAVQTAYRGRSGRIGAFLVGLPGWVCRPPRSRSRSHSCVVTSRSRW